MVVTDTVFVGEASRRAHADALDWIAERTADQA
jgi:hypothetical protein